MEIEHFDTDFFIDEIQKRPAIWDMESPDYKNKVIKKRNWEELLEIFCDAGDSLEKRNCWVSDYFIEFLFTITS
ncbi:hypothetical protein HF086_012784 [Spodoptera exigua]|uniref:MADF domain-containing protein n=1 Tax=Spodoptera exigua TaxID=7107 RepID=A0A922MKT7_SPOEX|nr:hypothetical protein HF086_012784 [Spodoptera exigua]